MEKAINEQAIDCRERAAHCRELAFRMSCPDRRAQPRRAAEHWEMLAQARKIAPEPSPWRRMAQARDYLARAAEAEGQAACGTGIFTTQLLGMAEAWRGMASKALRLSDLERRLACGDFSAPVS